jgi:ketosteroid isomerase-like protein
MKYILTLLFMSVCVNSIAQEKPKSNVKRTIDSLNRELEKAFNENDMMKVAAFYSDDAEIAGEGYSVKGRKNLDNYWLSLKDKGRGWKLEVIEVGGSGELVYQLGKSDLKHIRSNDPTPVSSIVNFIVIWKLQDDGTYKIFKDYITKTEFRMPDK